MSPQFKLWIVLFASYMAGVIVGIISARKTLKARYTAEKPPTMGVLRVIYDPDNPDTPAMGLEIESLSYILESDSLFLKIDKKNFPNSNRRVVLESSKDKSA